MPKTNVVAEKLFSVIALVFNIIFTFADLKIYYIIDNYKLILCKGSEQEVYLPVI